MKIWAHNLYSSYQVGLSNESGCWGKSSQTSPYRGRLGVNSHFCAGGCLPSWSAVDSATWMHRWRYITMKTCLEKSKQYWGWEICGYKWKDLALHKVDCPEMILQHQRFNKYQPVDDEVKIKGVASRGTEADHLTSTMHAIVHTVWREASLPVCRPCKL